MLIAIILAAAIGGGPIVLTQRLEVGLSSPSIRLGDVAEVADQRLRQVELARLPDGASRVVLTRPSLAALVRRALPGLVVSEGLGGPVTFHIARPARPTRSVDTLAKPRPPLVSRGDEMTLVSRSGSVTIERSVTALQPGRAGGRVFVRDRTGHVFALPIQEETK